MSQSQSLRPPQAVCADCHLQPFLYKDVPLDTKGFSIRLVRVHPARDIKADIIVELVKTNDPNISFDALSWCWGKGGWSKSIAARTIDGDRCLKVSANLETALRHLRFPDKFRDMWIDFLSIDQLSTEEKSRQVPQMAKIYGKANRVCIWLGDHDEKSQRAIQFIKKHMVNLQRFDQLCETDQYHDDWISLIEFFERAWFSRRWVIQELVLANQQNALVHCGDDTLTWTEFAEAVSLFESALAGSLNLKKILSNVPEDITYRSRYDPALGARQLVKATSSLFRTSSYHGDPLPLRTLEELVSSFWMYETSEPRDVIYALLSISKDALRLDAPNGIENEWNEEPKTEFDSLPIARRAILAWVNNHSIRSAFKVDYQASIVDVYRQFIKFSVSKADKSRALDIICRPWAPELTRGKHSGIELPSWICTLANSAYKLEHQGSIGQRLVRRNPDPLVGMPDQIIYSASGNLGPEHEHSIFKYWDDSGSRMYLRGFVLDEVDKVCAYSQLGNIPIEWLELGNWKGKGRAPEAFWRTLVADRGPDGQRVPLAFYPRACEFVFRHASDDTLDLNMLMEQGSTIIQDFVKRVQAVIWNRQLIRTKREKWLGLVPKAARPGDLICILYGCSVPVVLRKYRKDQRHLDAELRDENERRTNAATYIAKLWRDKTKRRWRNAERYQKMMQQQLESTVMGMGDQFMHPLPPFHGAYNTGKSPNTLPPIGSFTAGMSESGMLTTPTRQQPYYIAFPNFISPRPVVDHDFGTYYQDYRPPMDRDNSGNDDVMFPDFASHAMMRTFSNDPLYSSALFHDSNQRQRAPSGSVPSNELAAPQPMIRSISGGSLQGAATSTSGTNVATMGSMPADPRSLPPLSATIANGHQRTASPTPMHQTPPTGTPKRRPTLEYHPDTVLPPNKRISPSATYSQTPPSTRTTNGGPVGGTTPMNGTAAASKPKPPSDKHFYYRLIGESYVHGMMNGEAVAYMKHHNSKKTLEGSKIVVDTFELR